MLFERLILICDAEPQAPHLNMALDEVLLQTLRQPVLRVYRWDRPSVSFGCFGRFAKVNAAFPERVPVRRMTGGGIVLHGEDVTFALGIPRGFPLAEMSARGSYCAIHSAIAEWLRGLGMKASLAPRPDSAGSGLCFQGAAESDVLVGENKVAGGAQRRTFEGFLHEGSIQGIPEAWGSLLADAFVARAGAVCRSFTDRELSMANELVKSKYGASAWTERV